MKFAGAPRPPTVGAMLSGPIRRRSPSWLRNMAPPTASSSPTSPITTLSSPSSSSPSLSAAEAASAAICGASKCRSIGVPRRCHFGVLLGVAFLCALFPFDGVHGDDNNNNGAALDATAGAGSGNHADAEPPTTTEFNYAARGSKKITDRCDNTWECGFPGSVCDSHRKTCQCSEDLPVSNDYDKCGKVAAFNESCFFNEQCEKFNVQTECRDGRCICRFEMSPIINKDGAFECKGKSENRVPERYVDPAMIMILAGMALMFIIICVVLRLFSRARWRENRTIFNTPNPRLMNVSLLRESKLLHGQERRGSKMSVRMPSRQPSMASLRPHSPNPSLDRVEAVQETRKHPKQTNI